MLLTRTASLIARQVSEPFHHGLARIDCEHEELTRESDEVRTQLAFRDTERECAVVAFCVYASFNSSDLSLKWLIPARAGTFSGSTFDRWTMLRHIGHKSSAPPRLLYSVGCGATPIGNWARAPAERRTNSLGVLMKDPEKPQLPPCTCTECSDHQPNLCGKEAIVKAPDGTLFCADCLIARKFIQKQQSG
jgi:hypothetical protein